MSIEFVCPNCQQMLRVPDHAAGKPARCPKCQSIHNIPASEPDNGPSPFSDSASPWPPVPKPAPADSDANPYSSPINDPYARGPEFDDQPIQNQTVAAGTIINYAFEIWKANLGLLVGVFVVATAVSMAMDFVNGIFQGMLERNNVDGAATAVLLLLVVLGQFFAFALDIFLGIGQATIALKLARNQPAEFSDLFSAGPRFLPVLGASLLAALALFVGVILCIVPAILLMLFYWPFYYLLVDEKATALESFSMARIVTRNNVGTTFVLWLTSVGIALLGLLACGVGIIFAAPLCSMLFAAGYLMMSGQIPATPTGQKAPVY